MTRGCQNTLDKGVLTGRNLCPVRKGVALQVGVEIQQVIPAMGDTVDDDYFGSCLLTDADGLNVGFGSIVFEGEDLITAQMGIKVCRTVLRIDDRDFRPVACHTVSNEKRRIGLAAARSSCQSKPHLGRPTHGLS